MSSTRHPQFPSKGIPKMGDVVTMEISTWPDRQKPPKMCTEKGFVIYLQAITDDDFHIHLLTPLDLKTRTLIRKKGEDWKCSWLGHVDHDVTLTCKQVRGIGIDA